jgi:DNA-binding response OmpR family regulator
VVCDEEEWVSTFSGRWIGTNHLTFAQPRIVLVAPRGSTTGVIEQALRTAGAEVDVLDSALPATGVLELAPDLVLVDVPRSWSDDAGDRASGDLVRAVRRACPAETFVPIVALLEDGSYAVRDELVEGGADDVVRKPFDLAELFLRVDNLLKARRLHLELADLRSTNEKLHSLLVDLRPLPDLQREAAADGSPAPTESPDGR